MTQNGDRLTADLIQVQAADERWHAAAIGPGILCPVARDDVSRNPPGTKAPTSSTAPTACCDSRPCGRPAHEPRADDRRRRKIRTVNLWCNECDGVKCSSCDEQAIEFSNTVLDAILPQVTTVAELEALPKGSKLLGADGSTWQRNHVGSWLSDNHLTRRTERLVTMKKTAPLTVVWQP